MMITTRGVMEQSGTRKITEVVMMDGDLVESLEYEVSGLDYDGNPFRFTFTQIDDARQCFELICNG